MSGLELALSLPGLIEVVLRLCQTLVKRCRQAHANRLSCMQLASRVQRLQRVLAGYHPTPPSPEFAPALEDALREVKQLLENQAFPLLNKILSKPQSRTATFVTWMRHVKNGDAIDAKVRDLSLAISDLLLDLSFSLTTSAYVQRLEEHEAVMDGLGDIRRRYALLQQISSENKKEPMTVLRLQQIVDNSVSSAVSMLEAQTKQNNNLDSPPSNLTISKPETGEDSPPMRPQSSFTADLKNSEPTSFTPPDMAEQGFCTVDEAYHKLMTRRATLEQEVASILTNLEESEISEADRDASTALLESLLNPWRITIDKLRFTVIRGRRHKIGTGGFGRVFRGTFIDPTGQKHAAAIKTLNDPYATAQYRNDFVREVTLLRDLEHPCIVKFLGAYIPKPQLTPALQTWFDKDLDLEEQDDVMEAQSGNLRVPEEDMAMIVTELMHCNLHDAQKNNYIAWSSAAAMFILVDVAEAMRYLHAKRVVHLDLKPQNVLLRIKKGKILGRAKISDFGVSQTKQDTKTRTVTHAIGTRDYMAPEMMRPNRRLRFESDVWSFGVLICEMLSGTSIIGTMQDEEVIQAANEHMLHLRFAQSLRDISDRRVQYIARRCLDDDPQKRPAFTHLSASLRTAICGGPVHDLKHVPANGTRRDSMDLPQVIELFGSLRPNESALDCVNLLAAVATEVSGETSHVGPLIEQLTSIHLRDTAHVYEFCKESALLSALNELLKLDVLSDESLCMVYGGIGMRAAFWGQREGKELTADRGEFRVALMKAGLVGTTVQLLKTRVERSIKQEVQLDRRLEVVLGAMILDMSLSSSTHKEMRQSGVLETAALILSSRRQPGQQEEPYRITTELEAFMAFGSLNILYELMDEGPGWLRGVNLTMYIMQAMECSLQGRPYMTFSWSDEEIGVCVSSLCKEWLYRDALGKIGAVELLARMICHVIAREGTLDASFWLVSALAELSRHPHNAAIIRGESCSNALTYIRDMAVPTNSQCSEMTAAVARDVISSCTRKRITAGATV